MNNLIHFADDEEKMIDFKELTKEEFLLTYSYLTEEEYDATLEHLNGQICYDCLRKEECYSELGLKELKPNTTYKDMTGYECCVVFKDYKDAIEFIYSIGEAINKQDKKVQYDIINYIAKKYNIPLYNVMIEFDR